MEEVWAPDGLDSTGHKLGSEHAHKQSMLTSRVCSQAEYAHKQNGQDICYQEMLTVRLDHPDATWGNLMELLVDLEQIESAEHV